jgi:hypothetical protein
MVSDNGTGLDQQKFKGFLAPNLSYKTGKTRGHKGVGATYLAYGFNFIQVSTKTEDFEATGKMVDGRNWLSLDNIPNPQMQTDAKGCLHEKFQQCDKGVSIYLKFDKETQPKNLSRLGPSTADSWIKILSIKTGIGAVFESNRVTVNLTVVDKEGVVTETTQQGIDYLRINKIAAKTASFQDIQKKSDELFKAKGKDFTLPPKYKNLDAFYGSWTTEELKKLIVFDAEDLEICEKHTPHVYFSYVYSIKIWDTFNDTLGVRKNAPIMYGGIQIAANDMPQGELIQIPLKRNIGRQNQIHILIHIANYTPDMGRKVFKKEIVDFTTSLAKNLADGPLQKYRNCLRPNTGSSPDLLRENEVSKWTTEMVEHETKNPLVIKNPNFFSPQKHISITSIPTREQDVIALFNQLIAGGVIRGIQIMSTNERLTYDGLYRVLIEEPKINHIFDEKTNPLGINKDVVDHFKTLPFRTDPKILEYKFSFDALIEDVESGEKNVKDIGLVVVWETGEKYKEAYQITSLLDSDNLSLRQYHGATHTVTETATEQRVLDLIVLQELVDYLNDPKATEEKQRAKYEPD